MHIIVPSWGEPTGAFCAHYGDVIMGTIASQITSLTIVYSTIYSDANQRKHQSSASLAFVRGIHRSAGNSPGTSPHKWPVTRKMFPFEYVIMRKHQRHGKRFHVMTSSGLKEIPSQALHRKIWTQQFAPSRIEWWCPVSKKLSKITIINLFAVPLNRNSNTFCGRCARHYYMLHGKALCVLWMPTLVGRQNTRHQQYCKAQTLP